MTEALVPRIVVDSSVAVKWFIREGEPDVEEARRLLDDHLSGVAVLAAPEHMLLEVLNALRFRGLSADDLEAAARWLLGARIELTSSEAIAPRAAAIAASHDLTVYDAAFVALAESLEAVLITADRRLASCHVCRTRLLGSVDHAGHRPRPKPVP